MTEQEQEKVVPEKKYGVISGVLYGIGCGVGGSVFILLGTAINVAGTGVIISLLLGGILIFLTALNYSELSTSLPYSGGAYNFSKEGLGGFLAFIVGFFLWIANVFTCAFSAQAFSIILKLFFPFLEPIMIPILIVSIIVMVIIIYRTQKIAIRALVYFTIFLLILFSIFIVVGLILSPGLPSGDLIIGFNYATIISMFSLLFIFFTSITSNLAYFNADLRNPSKNIPKVNLLAIFFTTLIYILITVVVMLNWGTIGGEEDSPVLLALILQTIFEPLGLGELGYFIMGIAALLSPLIAMNAALGSSFSVLHALARDNYIPKAFQKVNKRKTPTRVILLTTIICIIITILAVVYADIGFTAETTIFIYFFGLAAVNFAAIRLRYRRKELDRPFKAPFFPVLPIIVGSTFLFLAFYLGASAFIFGSILTLIGIIYYLLKIADRYSVVLTIAGIKTLTVVGLGFMIFLINNFVPNLNQFFSEVLMRILIVIGIFIIGTIVLDIVPLREWVYLFIRKVDKQKVAIDIGVGQIIELKKTQSKAIYRVNILIYLIEILSSTFIFAIIILFQLDLLSIDDLDINGVFIPGETAQFLFLTSLFIFGIVMIVSGIVGLYLNRELKSLGI